MATVFVAGSMRIKHLDPKVKDRIDNIVESGMDIVVGDADGVDAAIQEYLVLLNATRTVVYCTGTEPRNNIGNWPVFQVSTSVAPGTRAFYSAKDRKMADIADYGLMVWDAKSTGTLSNVLELLSRHKKSLVFINKEKEFRVVGEAGQLESLVSCMSQHARQKADEKIRLSKRIADFKNEQSQLF